jgi:large subunit ribosomal protein L20
MRVKGGISTRRRRNKVLKRAKGFYSANSRAISHAAEKVDGAQVYEYRDRKVRKREFRKLWIQRINAAARLNGTSYSQLMGALIKAELNLDRKILADIAVREPSAFTELVRKVIS